MKILLLIIILFLTGCSLQKQHTRIYTHLTPGEDYTIISKQINTEFDNIYSILNKKSY